MEFDIAIRHFLTKCGFRLPGESQKIDRLVTAFGQCYWEDNPTAFRNADVVMILSAFAFPTPVTLISGWFTARVTSVCPPIT